MGRVLFQTPGIQRKRKQSKVPTVLAAGRGRNQGAGALCSQPLRAWVPGVWPEFWLSPERLGLHFLLRDCDRCPRARVCGLCLEVDRGFQTGGHFLAEMGTSWKYRCPGPTLGMQLQFIS